jgi:N-acetylglucosamine malate deacetylase 1
MNIMVLAPHPDDETIGCGGALCLHARAGDQVLVVCLTSGELGLKHLPAEEARRRREREAEAAGRILGVREWIFLRHPDWSVTSHARKIEAELTPILRRVQPGKVYLPHPADQHPDHGVVFEILDRALGQSGLSLPEVRGYEVWSPMVRSDYTVNITPVMARKMKALRAHQSQLVEFDYERAVRGLNQYRGALAGKCRYAEVFLDLSRHSPAA